MPRKPTITPEEKRSRKTQYMKEYYQRKKAELTEVRCQKIPCPVCFGRYTPSHKAQHLRSTRHTQAVKLRSEEPTSSDGRHNATTPENVTTVLKK